MREFAVGRGAAVFIALFMVMYAPSLYHHWLHRLFF